MELNQILNKLNIVVQKIEHEQSGKTTIQAVDALGEKSENILKSLLLKSKQGNYVGVIIPGNCQVNAKKVTQYLKEQETFGYSKFRTATPDEVKNILGYEIGGVPPFAFYNICPTFYDPILLEKEYVIGAGGNEFTGLKFNPQEIKKLDYICLDIIKQNEK